MRDIPYAVIDKDVYGQMDGATVMKLALVTHKKHQCKTKPSKLKISASLFWRLESKEMTI